MNGEFQSAPPHAAPPNAPASMATGSFNRTIRSAVVSAGPFSGAPAASGTACGVAPSIGALPAISAMRALPSGQVLFTVVCRPASSRPRGKSPLRKAWAKANGCMPVLPGVNTMVAIGPARADAGAEAETGGRDCARTGAGAAVGAGGVSTARACA